MVRHCERSEAIQQLEALTHFISPLPLPTDVADYYGKIRNTLARKGTPIENSGLWIAAHALSAEAILITNNLKEFSRVKGLRCENWV